MAQTSRRILAVIGALAVAIALVYAIEIIAGRLHPLPTGVSTSDPVALKAALESGEVPFAALLLVLAGWLLAAYVGGMLAWKWARETGAVWLFAVIFTALVISNLATLPHPEWMWIGGALGTPLFALGGGRQTLKID